MKKFTFLAVVIMMVVAGCSKEKEKTTPEPENKTVETDKKETPTSVPSEKAMEVQNVWESGLAAVKNCVEKRIAQTKQKGLSGYIIIEAMIGTTENPQNVRIVDKKLAVDNIESCIIKYLGGLVFPTWGYKVKYQHPYNLNILY
ncbi:MAG: hypothetical protein JXR95_06860 [Deltaproteobacteria bacterium]|nr:hypothetical protein [Deltaproteobacteria bacterium]